MVLEPIETDVLVVGAGPVGMTIAIDLAQRGVDVTILELRHPGELPLVKCNHVSARSMEVFRRLGLAGAVREAGLPADYPNDVEFGTTVTGYELARVPIPSRRDRYRASDGPDTWWPTPEPPHRINQIYLEPVLFEAARATPGIRIFNRTAFESFVEQDGGVVATATDLESETSFQLRSKFLVGCDGGRSTVRRVMGVRLDGTDELRRTLTTYLRAPELAGLITRPAAWMNLAVNPRRSGAAVAIDGRETWLVHCYLSPSELDFDAVDRDRAIREVLGVDERFSYEILDIEDYIARRLVAQHFQVGRAFICSDAAHIWIPVAGYGMNAGIADAMDLSWQLAAVVRGWAPESILRAYEAERRPITDQVSRFVASLGTSSVAARRNIPAEIELAGPLGDQVRRDFGRQLYDLEASQFFCAGLNFGYYYSESPIIAHDGEPPPFTMDTYTPSTVPGARAPHLFLADRRSLYDAFGPEFTIVRRDHAVSVSSLVAAAAAVGLPLVVLDLEQSDDPTGLYDTPLVLVRPDQHVAWRGSAAPADGKVLIDLVRGALG